MVRSDAAQHLSTMQKMEMSQESTLQNREQKLWQKLEAMHEETAERAAERVTSPFCSGSAMPEAASVSDV